MPHCPRCGNMNTGFSTKIEGTVIHENYYCPSCGYTWNKRASTITTNTNPEDEDIYFIPNQNYGKIRAKKTFIGTYGKN